MLYPIVSKFNWIDILIIICILRLSYIGLKRGLAIEAFKFVNLIFCSFAALHFYTILARLINSKLTALPIEAAKILSYSLLCFIITIIFRIIREGFFAMMTVESITSVSKICGFILGAVRGVIISGLIIFGLCISTIHYVELSAKSSYLGSKFVHVPAKIYEATFWGFVQKVSSEQVFNSDVPKALEAEAE